MTYGRSAFKTILFLFRRFIIESIFMEPLQPFNDRQIILQLLPDDEFLNDSVIILLLSPLAEGASYAKSINKSFK